MNLELEKKPFDKPIPPWGNGGIPLVLSVTFPNGYPVYNHWVAHVENHECGLYRCQPCGFRDIRKVRCPSNPGWNCEECPHAKPHTHLDRAWSIDDLTGNCRPFGSCPACIPVENEGEKKE